MRDIIAHHYFNIDPEIIFNICRDKLPSLIETVRKMIVEVDQGKS
ncbi:MAG: HepT-like ribonuclease domain-containing protein [Thermoguttaceae bacterium]